MKTHTTAYIAIISNGIITAGYVDGIAEIVAQTFHKPVQVFENQDDLSTFFDAFRKQYNANDLLRNTISIAPAGSVKTIGLYRVDLFIPILTYIFGQAVLNGPAAIASLHRLKNEFYGLKRNDALVLDRFKKVVVHELGHSFGLKHCYVPGCVMNSSTYVEDMDQKSNAFCNKCEGDIFLTTK